MLLAPHTCTEKQTLLAHLLHASTLHSTRLRQQERARGEVARDTEYVVERLMQELKRILSSKHIPTNLEKVLLRARARAGMRLAAKWLAWGGGCVGACRKMWQCPA